MFHLKQLLTQQKCVNKINCKIEFLDIKMPLFVFAVNVRAFITEGLICIMRKCIISKGDFR